MEFHPIESIKGAPARLAEGLQELRTVIIGSSASTPSNEELSWEEMQSFYRSKNSTEFSAMSGRLAVEHQRGRSTK
jgi:hypothetical protein